MSESTAVGKFKIGDFVRITLHGNTYKGVVHEYDFDYEYPYEVYVIHLYGYDTNMFARFLEEELDALD